jgi:fructan beta-fructosidase
MKKIQRLILGLLLLAVGTLCASTGQVPFDGHYKDTDYQETFRPQFHFSPQNGWMNDINALWYLDGTYHMTYQWGRPRRHGGYATSPDLLHWNDLGVALVPQDSHIKNVGAVPNVSGDQVYSGSGVVVSGEVAKKITGSTKPALVTLYTGTKVGTCIAWSNDGGETWNNYANNPVAHITNGANPRDPAVFWFEPEKKWVLAIYEVGTTFYESRDLIQWEKTGNIRFGHECPDLCYLLLDGDVNNKKWVLYDAHGLYLVGDFDGKNFIPEQEELRMDMGPDFYGAQTFFPENLPERKYIQIGWMDKWNGGVGERGWDRNATFPVELGLVSHEGKMRVTRTPVAAIEKLYGDSKSWKQVKMSGATREGQIDPLEQVHSKNFDLSVTINIKESTAKEVIFYLNGYPVRYLLDQQTIFLQGPKDRDRLPLSGVYHSLKQDAAGKVRLRFLVDWSCLEIFGNDGIFSFTEQYAFNPDDDTLDIQAIGGDLILDEINFNPIRSIWGERP